MHHGLANALLLPFGVAFLERKELNQDQAARIARVLSMFEDRGMKHQTLADACLQFVRSLGIQTGLSGYGIKRDDLGVLAKEAFEDPCHPTNMIPVTREDLLATYEAAL